jgi:maltose-binding protein MalE
LVAFLASCVRGAEREYSRECGSANAAYHLEKEFYPAAWKEAVSKNRVYAIPSGIDDRMLYYNRKLFRAAGLAPNKPPRTWDELKVAAKN